MRIRRLGSGISFLSTLPPAAALSQWVPGHTGENVFRLSSLSWEAVTLVTHRCEDRALCFVSIDGDGFSEPPTPLPGLVTHRDKMAEQGDGGSRLPPRPIWY